MSAAPFSTQPSPAELENLGVIFSGFVATTVLYGLTFFQTYIYFTRYPKDVKWLKYLVGALCTLDTIASALVSEILYYYLIILFDVNMDVLYATATFCVQYMLSVSLTFISSLFFAYRVFQVTGGARQVSLVVASLSFVALVFGLTASIQMFMERRLFELGVPHREVTVAISLAAATIADVIVVVTMCRSLCRARFPDMVVSYGFMPTAAKLLICRGLAFTVVQTIYFAVFMAAPSRPFWIPLQMVASKIYVNTLLGLLNSREAKQGRGFNEEVSTMDRKALTTARLPTPIRLPVNVSDGKSTCPSGDLTTQQGETENGSVGQETRKMCHDEHGNEYTQVSTGSSQSQMSSDEPVKTCLSEHCS